MARSCLFRRNKFAACLTAGTLLFPIAALTAPGDVDGRWSSVQITGEIITAAYHPEEGLWVAGSFENFSTSSQLNLTRLCPNGFRDTSAVPFIGTPISVIQMLPDRRLLLASADSTKLQKSSGSGNSGLDVGFAAAAPSAVNLIGVTPNREFLAGRSVAPWLVKISAAGAVDPNYVTDLAAPVLSVAVLPDGSCLAGGRSAGGPGFLTKISPAGMTDSVFATAFDGPVQTLVVQPDAKILVGGRFQTVNGAPRTGLVRLLPDGSVDASFLASLTGAPGIISVNTLLPQVDGAVLVSGTFTAVDGTSRPGMARLTASGALDPGFSHLDTARYGNDINLLTLMPDGRVVADVTGAPGKRLVILLENGVGSSSLALTQPHEITWSRSGSLPELSQVWFEMIQTDTSGNILPEGTPLGLGVRTSGGWKLTSPNLPTSGVVRAVGIGPSACGQSSGSLVFDTLSLATTVGRMSLRRLDSPIPTTAVTSLDFIAVWRGSTAVIPVGLRNTGLTSLSGLQFAITGAQASSFSVIGAPVGIPNVQETASFAVGFKDFTATNARAILTITGGTPGVPPLTINLSGSVTGSKSGTFDPAYTPLESVNGFNATGLTLTGLAFSTPSFPTNRDLVLVNNVSDTPISGTLSGWLQGSVRDLRVNNLARPFKIDYAGGDGNDLVLRPTFSVNSDPGFPSPFSGPVRVHGCIRQRSGCWLVAGSLASVVSALNPNKIPNPGLVRLFADGSQDESFRPTLPVAEYGSVSETESGKILVGDLGDSILHRLHRDGSTDATFRCKVNNWADSVTPLPGDRTLITGRFSTVNGVARNRIALLNADGSLDTSFAPNPDNTVTCSLAMPDGSFFIGGQFTQINGAARAGLARLSADGTLLPMGQVPQASFVRCLAQQQSGHVLYGANGYIRRFHESGNTGAPFASNILAFGPVAQCVIPQANGKILVGMGFGSSDSNNPFPVGAGRLNADGTTDLAFNAFLRGTTESFPIEVGGLHLSNDGTMVFGGDFTRAAYQPAAGFFRARLEEPVESLTISSPTRIEWLRGGSLPDTTDISFSLHQPLTNTWLPLGRGTAIPGGWELTGIALPADGAIRATARNRGGRTNSSHGFADTVLSFGTVLPDISLHLADGTPMPHDSAVMALRSAATGTIKSSTLSVENHGSGPLTPLTAILHGPDAAAFSFPLFNTTPLPAGQTTLLPVRFSPTQMRPYTAQLTLTSNDPDTPSYTINLTGSGATPIQAWREEFFNATADAGSAANIADPDEDGLTNLAEYALSFNALLSEASRLPSISSPIGFLELRLTLSNSRPDIRYTAEASPDPNAAQWTAVPNTGTSTALIFRIARTEARQFLRLRFSLQ